LIKTSVSPHDSARLAQDAPSGHSAGQRGPQAVVDAVGPIRGRDREHQLDHLLLVEVLAQRVEVYVVDVAGKACQQVGEA
jgi:hypothetical protein